MTEVKDGNITASKEIAQPQEIISKEETMFKIDNEGKAIPEKVPIYIYDRELDRELIEETMLLLTNIKKQKSVKTILDELSKQQTEEENKLQKKIDIEKDDKVKNNLQNDLVKLQKTSLVEEMKTRLNDKMVEEELKESRTILVELKKMKKDTTVIKYVELSPCTISEASLAFDLHQTIENKKSEDWVADLISRKLHNPTYTFEEAKRLKGNFKNALKEAIGEVSNYKVKSYRDIMLERQLIDLKPLTTKKE